MLSRPPQIRTALSQPQAEAVISKVAPLILAQDIEAQHLLDIILENTRGISDALSTESSESISSSDKLQEFMRCPSTYFTQPGMIALDERSGEDFKKSVRILIRLASLDQLHKIQTTTGVIDVYKLERAEKRVGNMIANTYPMMSWATLFRSVGEILGVGATGAFYAAATVKGDLEIAGININPDASKYLYKSASGICAAYALGKIYGLRSIIWPWSHISSNRLQNTVSTVMNRRRLELGQQNNTTMVFFDERANNGGALARGNNRQDSTSELLVA